MFSPVLGYNSDPELAQFVYDLWMWSRLGGAKNASGVPLRLALAGNSFSPEFWKTWHSGLLDMQKQLGFPTLFLTIAPYEWSFPYHEYMEDEMKKLLLARLHMAGPEAMHLAHVLTQTVTGFLTGMNSRSRRQDRCWTEHLLGPKDGTDQSTVLNFFARLEFQDGKRKRHFHQPQDYHGRGTVHLHCLIWLENIKAVKLEEVVCATMPEEGSEMEAVAKSGQLSWTGSGWPVRDEASNYNEDAGILELQHTEEDQEAGLRAFMPEVMAALKCHMDVQSSDGRGMLLRYCATYVPKFSDAFAQEWLNDQASDFAVARRVLSEYHPLEQEMWLQLASFLFRPCVAGGTMRRFVVPSPWVAEPPDAVQKYCTARWRDDGMTLLEFLRKTSKEGKIAKHIRQRMAEEAEDDESLEAFANRCACKGETFIAVVTAMRFSDAFYAQWTVMNVPFRRLADLNFDGLEKVPENFQGFAMALHHAPDFWRDLEQVRADLELAAFAEPFVQSNLAMVEAHTAVVDAYISGELVLGRDEVPVRRVPVHDALPKELHAEQWRVVDAIMTSVEQSVQRGLDGGNVSTREWACLLFWALQGAANRRQCRSQSRGPSLMRPEWSWPALQGCWLQTGGRSFQSSMWTPSTPSSSSTSRSSRRWTACATWISS